MLFSFKLAISLSLSANKHSNGVCIRNSVFARNNEPLPKILFLSRNHRFVIFKIPRRANPQHSPEKIIVNTKMGSTTNYNETIFIHTYPKHSPSNCLVYYTTPCSYCCKAVTSTPCFKAVRTIVSFHTRFWLGLAQNKVFEMLVWKWVVDIDIFRRALNSLIGFAHILPFHAKGQMQNYMLNIIQHCIQVVLVVVVRFWVKRGHFKNI